MNKSMLFIGVGFQQYNNYLVDFLSKKFVLSHYGTGEFKDEHKLFMQWAKYSPTSVCNHYRKALTNFIERTKNKHFDYVLVLKGTYMQEEHIELLQKYHPDAKYVLYFWDSMKRMDNGDILIKYFQNVYSFDSEDCKLYGFRLRPLFYLQTEKPDEIKYDVSFIGNSHSDRLKIIQELKAFCKANSISYRFVLPVGGSTYYKAKYLKKGLLADDADIISCKSIPYIEYLGITRKSKVIIDIPSPDQSGLTIRTIEALATGIKVITTNKHITEYENILKGMYYVWDLALDDRLLDFIKAPRVEFQLDSYYSLNTFFEEILLD